MTERANLSGLRLRWLYLLVFSLSFLVAVTSACGSTASAPPPASDQTEPPPDAADEETSEETLTAGNAEDGRALFLSKACAGCHTIEGIPEAQGKVGSELSHWTGNSLIADVLPNTDDNLRKWLKDPPAVKPGTLMPNQNLTDREIDALIAFLRTLK